ncbi:MAG: hypothetical protein AB1333_02155 [Patescibacteria group bacterium]
MGRSISIQEFKEIVPLICDAETAWRSKKWKEDIPETENCDVVALLAQEIFGGTLRHANLSNISGFENVPSHFWNRLPDGTEIDFTIRQFRGKKYSVKSVAYSRKRLLSFRKVRERYDKILKRFYSYKKS